MAEEIAKFRFSKYQILKSVIDITDISNISKELDIEIKRTNGENEEKNSFKLLLDVNIKDRNESLNIDIIAEGFFDFNENLSKEEMDAFFNVNAPAILFPYVRSYISTLTALSGINPIILPTINLSNRK
jgi:preprotein translocase subunit SecB